MDEQYFTVVEVAEKLKVTPQAVYKWIKQGKIAVVYAGTDARITGAEIEAFVKRSTEQRKSRRMDSGAKIEEMRSPSHDAALQLA